MAYLVSDLIARSMRIIGVLAAGESPSAEELADAFITLNDLVTNWGTERLNIYAQQRDLLTLTSGTQSYTIGTGGTFNVNRPLAIIAASVVNTVSGQVMRYPLKQIDATEWAALLEQAQSAIIPRKLYNDGAYPLSKLYFWPTPNTTGTQLELFSWTQLVAFATSGSTFDMPPGYARAMAFNLAVDLAGEYGRPLDPSVVAIAAQSKAAIRGLNAPPVDGAMEEAMASQMPPPPQAPQQQG